MLAKRSAEIAASGKAGEEVLEAFLALNVLDPAMGSGHFLVSAASYMALHIATDPSYDGVLDSSEIRRLVAERCLYGVDLNPMAVELARLALWLITVKGDEPLTFLANLREGNSLVGAEVDELLAGEGSVFQASLAREAEDLLDNIDAMDALPSTSGDEVHEKERLAAAATSLRRPLEAYADEVLAPSFSDPVGRFFHWAIEFPEIFLDSGGRIRGDGGFDAVIGNPPYIRIQALGREMAQYCRRRFETARGSFDAYIVFFERCLELLAPEGRLGFIAPNKFMKLDAGARLRELLTAGGLVEEIIDFGDAQVFTGATNYTAIVVLDRVVRGELAYSHPDPSAEISEVVRATDEAEATTYSMASLGGDPWVMATGDVARVLEIAKEGSVTLDEATDGIFTGLQTGADSIYILEDLGPVAGERRVRNREDGTVHVLEPDLLHPIASGTDVDRYAFRPLRSLLLFPYQRGCEGSMELVDEGRLASLPRTNTYLRLHEDELRGRERGGMDGPGWWAYTRVQSLGLHDRPKLGVAATVRRLEVAPDPAGEVYFHNVRVNGILASSNGVDLWALLALLNSRLLDFIFRRGAALHANGYFAANKQFIAPLPIRIPDGAHRDDLEVMGESLHRRAAEINEERKGFIDWLGGMIGVAPGGLEGRGRILAYDEETFDDWLGRLRVGARRAELSAPVGGRSFRQDVEAEWRASTARLAELTAALARDERRADELVFELYEMPSDLRTVVNGEYETG